MIVRKMDNYHYKVKSNTSDKMYDVLYDGDVFVCTCPHHTIRHVNCIHIRAVEESPLNTTNIRRITMLDLSTCPFCDNEFIVKCGIRKNRNYSVQIFKCKSCERRFSMNDGFKRMGASPNTITSALQLYFTGESLRGIQKFLELQGVKITHKTVWNWINKYINLMDKFLSKMTPKVSDTWRCDELYLRVKGNRKYLYSMMDDETRFWIARQVSNNKYTEDVRPLFKKSQKIACKKPKILISDGAGNFMDAHKKEWYSRYSKDTVQHIRHVHLARDYNNNKMERMNGEIRDREKTMRGLKIDDSPIITGLQIYHNYIRNHMGLKNDIPCERAGIHIDGDDKWMTIIKNADRQ